MATKISSLLINSFLLFAMIFIISSSVEIVSAQPELQCTFGVSSKKTEFANSVSCYLGCEKFCNPGADDKLDPYYFCDGDLLEVNTCQCCKLPVFPGCKGTYSEYFTRDTCLEECPGFCGVEPEDVTLYDCPGERDCRCCKTST